MMMIDVEEAEKAAHETCPCKFEEASGCRYRDGKSCACSTTMGHWKCGWPGHADIRTLRQAAHESGRLEQASHCTNTGRYPCEVCRTNDIDAVLTKARLAGLTATDMQAVCEWAERERSRIRSLAAKEISDGG